MNLYDVLAWQGTTHFERLFSQKFAGGEKTQTMTGTPPLTFKANGNPLISWSMKGNGSQTGTPTPDNPVMPEFCGVRTGNLFDGVYTYAIIGGESGNKYITGSSGRTAVVVCEPNMQYTVKKYDTSNRFTIAETDHYPQYFDIVEIIFNNRSAVEYTFTTSATAKYLLVYVSTSTEHAEPRLMLNSGTTALPYEPFGYKIPISCGVETTPVYLGTVPTTRRIKKLVLTEESNINKNTPNNPNDYLYYIGGTPHKKTDCICSHLRSTDSFPLASVGGVYSKYSAGILYINLSRDVMEAQLSGNTVAGFKEYLAAQYAAGTPVCVWYVLETPETAIVNEPLAKIGDYADELHSTDAGVSIPTVKGQNTLTVETDLQPSEMTITFKS